MVGRGRLCTEEEGVHVILRDADGQGRVMGAPLLRICLVCMCVCVGGLVLLSGLIR